MAQQKSDLLTFGRRLHDIGRVVVEAVHEAGGDDEDVLSIFKNQVLRRGIALLILGKLKFALKPSHIHAAELIPKGWEVVEDDGPMDFNIIDLELVPFLESNKFYMDGSVMREHAATLKGTFSLSDAKRILDHQDKIPAEWRGKYIIFTKTVLRNPDGHLYVAYIDCRGDRWYLDFLRLGDAWNIHSRLPRHK